MDLAPVRAEMKTNLTQTMKTWRSQNIQCKTNQLRPMVNHFFFTKTQEITNQESLSQRFRSGFQQRSVWSDLVLLGSRGPRPSCRPGRHGSGFWHWAAVLPAHPSDQCKDWTRRTRCSNDQVVKASISVFCVIHILYLFIGSFKIHTRNVCIVTSKLNNYVVTLSFRIKNGVKWVFFSSYNYKLWIM